MKQTNYHLFDFMDFDPALQRDERLWKAYAPTQVTEHDGDIIVTIPYQQQKRQEDMAPDDTMPQQAYDLIIRAYEPNILRLFTTMTGDEMVEQDDMLQMAPAIRRVPLTLRPIAAGDGLEATAEGGGRSGYDIVAADGTKRGTIDLSAPVLDHWSDLLPPTQPAPDITLYPDGDEAKPVALSDDHFSPPRYDALPLGFVNCGHDAGAAGPERATISFRCEADECFAGTGERFRKMDLSGQTFQLKNQDGQGSTTAAATKTYRSTSRAASTVRSTTPATTASCRWPTIPRGRCSSSATAPRWTSSSSGAGRRRRY